MVEIVRDDLGLDIKSEKNKERRCLWLACFGVTLEYFDVMLFIHLGTVMMVSLGLNEVPLMERSGYVFGYLSTILLRPISAIFWGRVGDKVGRTKILWITPVSVSLCCLGATFLPSYESAGNLAIYALLGLRAIQGFFWVGEKSAANVYITELIPLQRGGLWTSFACVAECLGSFLAMGLISVSLYFFTDEGWRVPFYIGSLISFVSILVRRNIEESQEFIKQKVNNKRHFAQDFIGKHVKNLWRFFAFELLFGAGFFFVYIYCAEILRTECGLSGQEVVTHNLVVTTLQAIMILGYGVASLRYDGLRMVQWRVALYLVCLPFIFFYFLSGEQSQLKVFIVQTLICLLGMDHIPCLPFLIKKIPVLIRMQVFAFAYAIGKLVMYLVTTFVVVWCVEAYGNWVLGAFFVLTALISGWGIWTYPRYIPGE